MDTAGSILRYTERARAPCALVVAIILGAASALGGCDRVRNSGTSIGPSRNAIPTEVPQVPSGAEMATAKTAFDTGNFGFAARYFQMAMEVLPNDLDACLGLAASYDWLYRFDLSDQIYGTCKEINGDSFSYYNNVGFSHLMRGEYGKASVHLSQARALRPGDPVVETNLRILRDASEG